MMPDDKNLEILEAIFHDAALVAAEEGESTPEKKAWAAGVRRELEQRVAEMRAKLATTESQPERPIAARYIAMARDALLARIDALMLGGRVQVAHRNLSALSDDDLRRLLESIVPDSE